MFCNRHLLPALIPENPDLSDSPRLPLGDFRLDKIERAHLKILVAALTAKKCSRVVNETVKAPDGTVTTKKKTIHFNLAKPSLQIILSGLTTCLTNAQREDGLIPTNPALSLGKFIKQAKRRHESIDSFEPQEVPVFLKATKKRRWTSYRCSSSYCIREFAAANAVACNGRMSISAIDTCSFSAPGRRRAGCNRRRMERHARWICPMLRSLPCSPTSRIAKDLSQER